MNDVNPYESPKIPASSTRHAPLHLILGLVAAVLLTPLVTFLTGLISYGAMQMFAKAATNSQPTTDPIIIVAAVSILFVPPTVTLCGMMYWISTIVGAIIEKGRRSKAAQEKDPSQS